MIPKKIHYCWFGRKELPSKAKKCIRSWKKNCPDYEIIEWNEDNFDINQNQYTQYTYNNKKYAFLSDYARLFIVYKEGGIYFDVDVEIVRPLDELLLDSAFFGFETNEYVNTGIGFGAEKESLIIKQLLDEYIPLLDGTKGTIGCPILNTVALKKCGLIPNGKKQTFSGVTVYPISYFNPYDDPTGRLNITEETYSIHWFAKSWMNKRIVIKSKLLKPIHRLFGTEIFHKKRR